MDVVRKKALGRYLPRRGKDRRITRTDGFLKRQSQLILSALFNQHSVPLQGIKPGLKHIYGTQNVCTWRICGVTV
jgi:hypothetical protein